MLLYIFAFYSTLAISQITAQSCDPDGETGPCIDNACQPGQTCIIDTQTCCVDDNVIPAEPSVVSEATTIGTGSTLAPGITIVPTVTLTPSVTASTCVDKINPRTGRSDCPARASLCNDANYIAVMTEQCPKTCGKCSGTGGTTTCIDRVNPATGVSDCPALAHLCNNAAYTALMTEQCPLTCNRCSSVGVTSATTVSGTCADKLNPKTGVSDCPMRVSLCQDSNYIALMRVECPKTCGFCTGSTVTGVTGASTVSGATVPTRAPGTCVDAINPLTGTSDCPSRVALCNDAAYRNLMVAQCPRTCGVC
ncbi:unnamed protein product [Cylicocyclus nassatus]|uniref:ShKT domain-containing protein n=1 Tax=Cylicocyclus nassatus TaxID=53992 RepID=A0AA36DR06_CYLNA|nr:unnamed protein product [Cylicocyclus nassatus]